MGTDKTYGAFSQLPTWAKGIVAIGVLAGVGFVGYKIYKGIEKRNLEKKTKATADDAGSEARELAKTQKLAFAKSDYEAAANFIAISLAGCETAATEMAVISKIKAIVKHKIDWLYLVSIFGSKNIKDCGLPYGDGTQYDLPSLLTDQLDTNLGVAYQGKETIEILREYLSKIGVAI